MRTPVAFDSCLAAARASRLAFTNEPRARPRAAGSAYEYEGFLKQPSQLQAGSTSHAGTEPPSPV